MTATPPSPDPGEASGLAPGTATPERSRTAAAGAELARAIAADGSALARRAFGKARSAWDAMPPIAVRKPDFRLLGRAFQRVGRSIPVGHRRLSRRTVWIGGIAAVLLLLVGGFAGTLVWALHDLPPGTSLAGSAEPSVIFETADGKPLARKGPFKAADMSLAGISRCARRCGDQHRGPAVLQPLGARFPRDRAGIRAKRLGRRGRAGRQHDQPAARENPAPGARPHAEAQDPRGGHRGVARHAARQGRDPDALSEQRLSRRRRDRHAGGRAHLFRQEPGRPDAGGIGAARRPHQGAVAAQPAQGPRRRPRQGRNRARRDGGGRPARRGRRQGGQGESGDARAEPDRCAYRDVVRRLGRQGGGRDHRLVPRDDARAHHAHPGAAGGRRSRRFGGARRCRRGERRVAGGARRPAAGRRRARHGGRQELPGERVQPGRRRHAPARLGLQALRLLRGACATASRRATGSRTLRSRSRAGSRRISAKAITAG